LSVPPAKSPENVTVPDVLRPPIVRRPDEPLRSSSCRANVAPAVSSHTAALPEPPVEPITGRPPVIVPAPLNWSTPSSTNTEPSLPEPNVSEPVTRAR